MAVPVFTVTALEDRCVLVDTHINTTRALSRPLEAQQILLLV